MAESERTTGGTSEVHTEINFEPSKGLGMSGKFEEGDAGTMQQARDRANEMVDQARERADDMMGQARGLKDRVQERATTLKDQAEQRLERTGIMDQLEQRPLVALGLAFGIGFLLAGSSDASGTFGKAKHQIRGALMGALTAAMAQKAQEMIGLGGGGSMDTGSML